MFTLTARYALRALAELSMGPEGSTLLGRQIAERARIPSNYLSKILWTLGAAGLIDATRGIRGGYRLRRRPEEITLLEIVALFEKPRRRRGCLLYESRDCSAADPCPAHEAWNRLGQAQERFLTRTTLAEVSGRPGARRRGRSGAGNRATRTGRSMKREAR